MLAARTVRFLVAWAYTMTQSQTFASRFKNY
jgi:hypothetical protein